MSAAFPSIICCGFTPCIQRILEFQHVEKGEVNRAGRVVVGIGGKGANTARIIRQLGRDALLIGFAGGANGRLLAEMLTEEGVDFRHVEVEGETRICQTLVEAGNPETTELVEEMPPISDEEWRRMTELFQSLRLDGTTVAISGRLPAGAPVDAYGRIAAAARPGGRVIVDVPGEPLLCTLEHEPYMVKINAVELMQTVGGEHLVDSALKLIGLGACSVLVTRGAGTAFYVDEVKTLEITPPKIDAVNPVGSGDAVTAGIAVALDGGAGVEEMLEYGIACGTANALHLVSGRVDPDNIDRLRRAVRINPVK